MREDKGRVERRKERKVRGENRNRLGDEGMKGEKVRRGKRGEKCERRE